MEDLETYIINQCKEIVNNSQRNNEKIDALHILEHLSMVKTQGEK